MTDFGKQQQHVKFTRTRQKFSIEISADQQVYAASLADLRQLVMLFIALLSQHTLSTHNATYDWIITPAVFLTEKGKTAKIAI